MAKSDVVIVDAKPEDCRESAPLIFDSVHELMTFMLGDQGTATRVIEKLFKRRRGHFSHRFATVARLHGDLIGIELGYDKETIKQQDLPGSLLLFALSPPSRWRHLMGTVDRVLKSYVPPPDTGTYYINNIAVAPSMRGHGVGKQLLTHVIERAKSNGYDAVELDVTADNDAGIRFYKKYGFKEMYRSGSDELHQAYGLPPLVRMRLDFRPILELATDSDHLKKNDPTVINDITGLNPVPVSAVFAPSNVEQLRRIVENTDGPLSVGGGKFSMGGQTSYPDSLHIDMRGLNKVLAIDPDAQTIHVQAGARWRDIQALIDKYNLSIKIMQTYANFTVGGSISVNCHGRYLGLGPIVLSIKSVDVMLHDGKIVKASPDRNKEIFYSVVGGYGAIGIIVSAVLSLSKNVALKRQRIKLNTNDYAAWFASTLRGDRTAVFHNADLYPPNYDVASSVTWFETPSAAATAPRLKPRRRLYLLDKYLMWAITETPLGRWRRQYILEPFYYLFPRIHMRNYEAGYDVGELEPLLRDRSTYVLQEYFVPVGAFTDFVARCREILNRFDVNVVNISIRHAFPDPGSKLAWARQECFAFVLYYKQSTAPHGKYPVQVWTRELIAAAIELGGSYYLPYQPHATPAQFHAAYPDAKSLFAIKKKRDPDYRFRNALWAKYYDVSDGEKAPGRTASEFKAVYSDDVWQDRFYLFLQNIYRIFPEERFHALIHEACAANDTDKAIYAHIQRRLHANKPFLSELTYAVPALIKQKRIIADQMAAMAFAGGTVNGYLEIGSTGRYVRPLKKRIDIQGPIYLCNDIVPDFSPPEILERGQLPKIGRFFDLDDYAPIPEDVIGDSSLDLVSCFIGLHHCRPAKLKPYIRSIKRTLRDGSTFVLRDHNAPDEKMITFVSLVHTVFNAGLNAPWQDNEAEERHFAGLDHWVAALEAEGFEDLGYRILQDHDPSLNTLMAFRVRK